jgi:aspartate/methionine/tyrosine aminotransferase
VINKSERLNKVGEYYFSQKLREISALGKPLILNLGIGNPDLPPSSATIHALQNSVVNRAAHGYQPYNGHPDLRQAFAEWYARYFNVILNPDSELLPLTGSKEGILHISLAFLNPGDKVLIPDPGYSTYSSATQLAGAIPKYYDLLEQSDWLPNFDNLTKSNLKQVKLMWVNYPHMPTGAKGNIKLFQQLIDFGNKNNILICHDNPYSFILNDMPLSILSIPGAKDISLELNSLSKSHNMAGWRIGIAAGKADYIDAILQVKSNIDSGQFLPIQQAAIEALHNSQDWLEKLNIEYRERKILVCEVLDILQCKYSREQAGLFVWAQVPKEYVNGDEFSDWLLERNRIFVTPGSVFGKNGEKYIRVSLCTNLEILKQAIGQLQ